MATEGWTQRVVQNVEKDVGYLAGFQELEMGTSCSMLLFLIE